MTFKQHGFGQHKDGRFLSIGPGSALLINKYGGMIRDGYWHKSKQRDHSAISILCYRYIPSNKIVGIMGLFHGDDGFCNLLKQLNNHECKFTNWSNLKIEICRLMFRVQDARYAEAVWQPADDDMAANTLAT